MEGNEIVKNNDRNRNGDDDLDLEITEERLEYLNEILISADFILTGEVTGVKLIRCGVEENLIENILKKTDLNLISNDQQSLLTFESDSSSG